MNEEGGDAGFGVSGETLLHESAWPDEGYVADEIVSGLMAPAHA